MKNEKETQEKKDNKIFCYPLEKPLQYTIIDRIIIYGIVVGVFLSISALVCILAILVSKLLA